MKSHKMTTTSSGLRDVAMSTRNAEVFDASPKSEDWLNPIAMSQLQAAVLAKKNAVHLGGIAYGITYGHIINLPVTKERRALIHLVRKDGELAPRGYISVEKIRKFDFEQSEDK